VVVHLSVLIVLVSALVQIFFGVEGQIMLPEGGSLNLFLTSDDDLLRLPFDISCDKFEVEFYEGTRQPKEFISELTIWQGGQKQVGKTIQVNDPLTFRGFRFFQSSYSEETFPLIHVRGEGIDRELPVVLKQIQSIPGTRDGFILSGAREVDGGVELHVQVQAGGERHEGWLREKAAAQTLGPYALTFTGTKRGFYTGLLVSADPSVGFLWVGFTIFFIGLCWAMYTSHRRVWVRIEEKEIVFAATTSRNREALTRWLNGLADGLRKG